MEYDLDEFIRILEKLRDKFGGDIPVSINDNEITVLGVFDEDGNDCEEDGSDAVVLYIEAR